MDIEQFRHSFNPSYTTYLRSRIDEAKASLTDETLQNAVEHVFTIFGERGKRIRPYMLYLMYASAGGKDDVAAFTAGIGSELLHAFALVHDDVADRGEIRHDITTIHEYVRELLLAKKVEHDVEHLSNIQAILVGDLMMSWSFSVLHSIENQRRERVHSLFHEMTVQLVCGEMMDLSFPTRSTVSDDELGRRDLYKTSADTFITPMLIGAVLADQEAQYSTFCSEFGTTMGEVFQIHDDILDILGEDGTPEHSDIKEHQHTFLTQYVLKSGSVEEKDALAQFFSGKTPDSMNEKRVLEIVSQPHVINYGIAESKQRLVRARAAVDTAQFLNTNKEHWLEMIAFFERRFDS